MLALAAVVATAAPRHFADANDRAGYNSWAKRFKQ